MEPPQRGKNVSEFQKRRCNLINFWYPARDNDGGDEEEEWQDDT